MELKRLGLLEKERFLTKRLFEKVSENMHYEIFKFLNPKEILEARAIKLGGYQLASNSNLRPRIKNFLDNFNVTFSPISTHTDIIRRFKLLFSQTNRKSLGFSSKLQNEGIIKLSEIMEAIPELEEIHLSKINIYIFIIYIY